MNTEYNFPISCRTVAGCDVKTIKEESVGTIKDIMVDTETGDVAYIVLELHRDFLNLGNKYLALPWEAFDFHGQQRKVILVKADKEKLENAPGFEKDSWPVGSQHQFIGEIKSYYGYDRRKVLIE
ncbi:PRC-barrel domain-containing protein [Algoriphagus halophytocola]|uniref:PRC-barrel domain-containing protein n=1 Tax=Algoriphagus halophytocola TaxID=2991499 RepID=A0ABY6MP21_9BACT|nr:MULTISPECIES: PRC-barrel domain-containing protein [unclassified Algoriphagus]UZD24142.1 PRC-barrel domain-containing protein [Algoriphagus sp. TR-M5]WBL41513.1 PRC-barrel domain-containing protein [Algoriphagus sp. TR-M9]